MGKPEHVATRGSCFENRPVHPERYIHGSTLPVQVVVDDRQPFVTDDRTGMSVGAFQKAFLDHRNYSRGTQRGLASANDLDIALALTVRDRLMHRWIASRNALHDAKMVCYPSAEFLLGRQLGNNLLNIVPEESTNPAAAAPRGLRPADHDRRVGFLVGRRRDGLFFAVGSRRTADVRGSAGRDTRPDRPGE